MRITIAATLAVLVLAAGLAAGDSVALPAIADTYVYGSSNNYGTNSSMRIGADYSGSEAWGLLAFDTSALSTGIPVGSRIDSVHLWTFLYSTTTWNEADSVVAAWEVLESWDETTVTGATRPARGAMLSSNTQNIPYVIAELQSLEWDVTGAWAESGWLDFYLAPTNPDEGETLGSFGTRETGGYESPKLLVEYTRPEEIPEPCTLALMGLGLGGLILKRRRSA